MADNGVDCLPYFFIEAVHAFPIYSAQMVAIEMNG